jgi:hypothetical protein
VAVSSYQKALEVLEAAAIKEPDNQDLQSRKVAIIAKTESRLRSGQTLTRTLHAKAPLDRIANLFLESPMQISHGFLCTGEVKGRGLFSDFVGEKITSLLKWHR